VVQLRWSSGAPQVVECYTNDASSSIRDGQWVHRRGSIGAFVAVSGGIDDALQSIWDSRWMHRTSLAAPVR